MTEKTIDWLNQNRYRAYPFVNDVGLISGVSRIPDCILLDCLVVDTRNGIGIPEMTVTKYVVGEDQTDVYFRYGEIDAHCTIKASETSGSSGSYGSSSSAGDGEYDIRYGEGSFVRLRGTSVGGIPSDSLHISLTFSSHEHIREKVGTGTWEFNGRILPSKVVVSALSGVSGLVTGGSATVSPAGTASGDVHLRDGYRTQAEISNGKVIVRVGTSFGIDPCHYPYVSSEGTPCGDMLLFFCGQNAINGGNVVIYGGPGVSVNQGRDYEASRDVLDTFGNVGIEEGERVPCIEISAASELLRMYRPTTGSSS